MSALHNAADCDTVLSTEPNVKLVSPLKGEIVCMISCCFVLAKDFYNLIILYDPQI